MRNKIDTPGWKDWGGIILYREHIGEKGKCMIEETIFEFFSEIGIDDAKIFAISHKTWQSTYR